MVAERIYTQVECMPLCETCMNSKANMYKMDQCTRESFNKWVIENMSYPPIALETKKETTCLFKVVVDTMGYFTEIRTASDNEEVFTTEATRLLKSYNSMNPWKPATQRKKKVKVILDLAVEFNLKRWEIEQKRRLDLENQMRLDSIQRLTPHPDSLKKQVSGSNKKK